jgi:hypothetical protein
MGHGEGAAVDLKRDRRAQVDGCGCSGFSFISRALRSCQAARRMPDLNRAARSFAVLDLSCSPSRSRLRVIRSIGTGHRSRARQSTLPTMRRSGRGYLRGYRFFFLRTYEIGREKGRPIVADQARVRRSKQDAIPRPKWMRCETELSDV